MKTINSLRSKLLALTLALMASVSTFAYEFEYVNDFHVDGFAYKVLPPTMEAPFGNVALIEIADCTEDVVIPGTVTHEGVTYIVTTLGGGATLFTNSAKEIVKSVFIPKKISTINSPLFADCSNLTSIVVDSRNSYYDSRENCNAIITTSQNSFFTPNMLIAGCKTTTIPNSVTEIADKAFYRSAIESITIPTGVTKIGHSAFNQATLLSSIKLPITLTEIGYWAFADCLSLNTISCYALEPPTISSNTFFGSNPIYNNPSVYVPAYCIEAYKNAEHWKWFTQILPINEPAYKDRWCDTWNVLTIKRDLETWQYNLAHDTIIGDYTYTAVTRHTTKVPAGVYPVMAPEPEYVAAVRFTEDKKAFIYYDNTEYLLYDFNAQPGDELTVFAGINHYRSHKTNRCGIGEVNIFPDSNYYYSREISLTVVPNYNHSGPVPTCAGITKWIEGVGDICGLITGADCGLSDDQSALLCAYKDGNTEYTTEEEEYAEYGCKYNSGENKEYILTLPGLQRTSFTEYSECSDSFASLFQSKSETITINHNQYLKFGGHYLREENKQVLLYSRLQDKDLVLYDYSLEVGDTLTTLNIDYRIEGIPFDLCYVDYAYEDVGMSHSIDTLIVTDVSMITLLDGKEYKKWTFNNGMEYVEGIGSFGNGQWSGDFFQLIANKGVPTCLLDEHLVCASKNGQLLYQMDDAEMERLGAECLCDVEKKWSDTWCDTWNVMEHDMGMLSDTEKTWRHYLANDTIINGQTYTSVNYYWTLEESKVYKIAHVRFSENKKVYALMDDTEYLVYDFSVQVGDTIETIVGVGYGSMLQQLLVHQVDIDDATNRKTITLYPLCKLEEDIDCDHCDENGYYLDWFPIQWIEGVGTTDGFLMGYPPCDWVGGIGCDLLCAYKDDELKYTGDLYDEYGCEYNATEQKPEDLFPTLWGLQRTDVELHTTGDNELYRSTFNEYVPTLVNGKWYLYDGENYLREENNQVLLYAPDAEIYEDIVLYDWTLEVGDTLPYHNKSVYRESDYIVTDVSTITLLDGKEYKKWTLACGYEYIESIGAINGHGYGLFLCLPHYGHWATYIHTSLVCASRNGKLLYQMDDAEMERLGTECLCDYNSGPKKDNAKNGKIGGRPTPTQWNQLELDLREMENGNTILRAETFSYTLENDSIVANNKTFYQLARQSTKDTAITKSFVGALHFGEYEDNRVYFLRDGVEYVLYDFTAEPGDTIEIFAGINNYPLDTTYTHVVVDKDTTEDGACRMFLEVVFPEETASVENAQKVWLAGLGSIDGIVHNAAKRTSDVHATPRRSASSETQTSVMLCAWREDSCLYTTNHPEYDTFGCVYNQDPTAVEDVQTSGDKYQKIIRDGHLYILRDNKLYDVLGTPMN